MTGDDVTVLRKVQHGVVIEDGADVGVDRLHLLENVDDGRLLVLGRRILELLYRNERERGDLL